MLENIADLNPASVVVPARAGLGNIYSAIYVISEKI
jgi:hypothetical protein